ncbi:MAG: lipase family protein [Alphaproteobacteria bacterium]
MALFLRRDEGGQIMRVTWIESGKKAFLIGITFLAASCAAPEYQGSSEVLQASAMVSSPAPSPAPSPAMPRAREQPRRLTDKEAEQYVQYAMMASNAYHDWPNRYYFPLQVIGWHQIDWHGNPTQQPTFTDMKTGLAFDIFANDKTKDIVVAFRGTDDLQDWISNLAIYKSPQYEQARYHFGELIKKFRGRQFMVTGHSLGGGLALHVSATFPAVKAVVFDSSPRVFDHSDRKDPADRLSIHQNHEVLEVIRTHWPAFLSLVDARNIYETDFDFCTRPDHRMDLLAKGLLEMASKNRKIFKKLLGRITPPTTDTMPPCPTLLKKDL